MRRLVAGYVTAGLLRSMRGVGGGVVLARPPSQIKLRQIIEFLEGPTALLECIANPSSCKRCRLCVTRDVWAELDAATRAILDLTTLQELADRHAKKAKAGETMYYI